MRPLTVWLKGNFPPYAFALYQSVLVKKEFSVSTGGLISLKLSSHTKCKTNYFPFLHLTLGFCVFSGMAHVTTSVEDQDNYC